MDYRPDWNLGSIPQEIWNSEHGRRNAAMRKTRAGGRPKGTPNKSRESGLVNISKKRPKTLAIRKKTKEI